MSDQVSSAGTVQKERQKYFKIRVNSLHAESAVPFDVYVLINNHFVHYLRAGTTLSQQRYESIEKRNQEVFYILYEDRQQYKSYIRQQLLNDRLKSEEKALILRESSMVLVEELFDNEDIYEALNDSKEIIGEIVDFMQAEPEGVAQLIQLSAHDFYTYNHSLDVSIYSLGLGTLVGYSKADLEELGQGSLFHDLGKRHVHVDIICKNGPLNEVEWAQMQKHPQYGLKILMDYKDVSDAVKACAFEHHENFMGTGYPQQLQGEEIHHMARIVALTDTFDALTTQRSYNQPMSPRTAVEFIQTKLSQKYDPDLLRALCSILFQKVN